MKKISRFLFGGMAAVFAPLTVNAAGTYYTGNYQSPQTRYTQRVNNYRGGGYAQQGISAYSRNQYANAGYTTKTNAYQRTNSQQAKTQVKNTGADQKGFSLGAGFSRQTSMWQFEMKTSDSVLHYDNVDWNVFDVNAGYVFDAGNTQVQIAGSFQYGMQAGESTMVDDDITNGGYLVAEYDQTDDYENVVASYQQIGHALSIGTSKDGSMLGFNGGIGLKDFMKWGNLKITPSVGWRYLKYTLETHNNHGLAMETLDGGYSCYGVDGTDETQCDPVFIWYTLNADGTVNTEDLVLITRNEDGYISVPDGLLDMGGNYYYAQPGISHKYEVEWSGPYLALDMLYDINANNSVDARVELGLPSYTATGDQPYRFDWAHPKSVEDSAGVGGAFHLGLGANWKTALSDKVSLTIGVTYDYYTVSDADAKTYLNEDYYMGVYNEILAEYEALGLTEDDMLSPETGNDTAISIMEIEQECPGWVCSANGEIESFYKSLGVRVGINARF